MAVQTAGAIVRSSNGIARAMSLLISALIALSTLLWLAWPGLKRDAERREDAQAQGSAGISNTCRR
jgi:hypothetical protein